MSAKRVYTQELHDAVRGPSAKLSNASMLEDQLVNALQNVGSRVRKNVSEGYATSRFTTPNASPIRPLVPNSSPIGNMSRNPILPPIFSSAADTLKLVYGGGSSPQVSPNPSPSRPAKRARAIEDEDAECHVQLRLPLIPRSAFSRSNFDEDDAMDLGGDVDDGMVMDAPASPSPRHIRPLKRGTRKTPPKENVDIFGPVTDRPDGAWQAANISELAKLPPE